jgi:hypothetical protein
MVRIDVFMIVAGSGDFVDPSGVENAESASLAWHMERIHVASMRSSRCRAGYGLDVGKHKCLGVRASSQAKAPRRNGITLLPTAFASESWLIRDDSSLVSEMSHASAACLATAPPRRDAAPRCSVIRFLQRYDGAPTQSEEVAMGTRQDWILLFCEFTLRNAGRPTRLELHDPDLGVQVVEEDIPLHGIAYDPRDDRIEILLGETRATERHLTHTVGQVSGVELLRSDGAGRELCIVHRGTRTLLFIRRSNATRSASGRLDERSRNVT